MGGWDEVEDGEERDKEKIGFGSLASTDYRRINEEKNGGENVGRTERK